MALTLGLYEELDYTKPADPVAQPVKISSDGEDGTRSTRAILARSISWGCNLCEIGERCDQVFGVKVVASAPCWTGCLMLDTDEVM